MSIPTMTSKLLHKSLETPITPFTILCYVIGNYIEKSCNSTTTLRINTQV